MKLSVVITTRNEADNIANCIRAFDAVRRRVRRRLASPHPRPARLEVHCFLNSRLHELVGNIHL